MFTAPHLCHDRRTAGALRLHIVPQHRRLRPTARSPPRSNRLHAAACTAACTERRLQRLAAAHTLHRARNGPPRPSPSQAPWMRPSPSPLRRGARGDARGERTVPDPRRAPLAGSRNTAAAHTGAGDGESAATSRRRRRETTGSPPRRRARTRPSPYEMCLQKRTTTTAANR